MHPLTKYPSWKAAYEWAVANCGDLECSNGAEMKNLIVEDQHDKAREVDMKDPLMEDQHDKAREVDMKNLMMEDRFDMIRQEDKDFIIAFTDEMAELGYGFDGKISDGFCWGKYMIIYTKRGVKNKNVIARVYIREDGIVLRLYLNKIDEHREYLEKSPSHIKNVFIGEYGNCKHCHNEKGGACKFRKTYVLGGNVVEKCNGMTFEFWEPNIVKLSDYMDLIREFLFLRQRLV